MHLPASENPMAEEALLLAGQSGARIHPSTPPVTHGHHPPTIHRGADQHLAHQQYGQDPPKRLPRGSFASRMLLEAFPHIPESRIHVLVTFLSALEDEDLV